MLSFKALKDIVTEARPITITVEVAKTTMLVSIAFGISAGLIVGFVIFAIGQSGLDDKTVESGLFVNHGKVYRLTEVHAQ